MLSIVDVNDHIFFLFFLISPKVERPILYLFANFSFVAPAFSRSSIAMLLSMEKSTPFLSLQELFNTAEISHFVEGFR